ncbi:Acriflavin resistance protein [Capnocytophaga canis]|uniref:Acriflavin resistance protein n=1 Tax=Capnocytophaga canis TaxID=1848903 RepID=A0A0B7IKB7_9FLAO|nr:Acriflavin resistance protein [Capnocytophaga canis]
MFSITSKKLYFCKKMNFIKKSLGISSFQILIIFSILSILGILVIPKLSVHLNPNESLPSISVKYHWSNATPYAIEKEVTSVLEGGFSRLKGLMKLKSKSSKNYGIIYLEFDKHTNIDDARFEVATIIRQLHKKLPQQVSYPTIDINKPNEDEQNQAFLIYTIGASVPYSQIQQTIKNQIEPIINSLSDVDKVIINGITPEEFVINYDLNELKQLSISTEEILQSLKNQFTNQSLGEVFYRDEYITISINCQEKKGWHIPIKKIGDRIIYLDQIATVKKVEQEVQHYFRINSKNAITMSIYATKNANTIMLAKKIDSHIQEISSQLPREYSISKTHDVTEYLSSELDKIYERTIYTIVILLLFIYLVSFSFRYLSIILLSLVCNLSISFLLYYFLGVEIQLYSLAGITISLGLIIDNSIVMIDHIKKQGNISVFIPVLASTLTTMGALTIIYFLDDKYKVNLIDFALVIIINLGVSLFVALFLIPTLMKEIPTGNKNDLKIFNKGQYLLGYIYEKCLYFSFRIKKILILGIVLLFGIPFFMLPQKLENNTTFFEKTYNKILGNDWYIENIRPHIDKYLGGTLRLFKNYVFENANYGNQQETKLHVEASMEKGASIHQMNETILYVENYLQQFTQLKQYITNVYSGNYAHIEISFKNDVADSHFPITLKGKLIAKTVDLGGIDWKIYGVGNFFTSGIGHTDEPTNFTVKGYGYNYDALNSWIDSLKTNLQQNSRVKNILINNNSNKVKTSSEYIFLLDKELLTIQNSNPLGIFSELRELTSTKQRALYLNMQGGYFPIRLESYDSKINDIWKVVNYPLGNLHNPLILKKMVLFSKQKEEDNIRKENQEYIRYLQFQYTGSAKVGQKILDEKLVQLEKRLPLGYKFEVEEEQWRIGKDKENNYFFLLLLILCIIYTICAILFESFKQPFIILSVIPISFIGVFLTFYIFSFNFDQGGLASFVLLSGIIVNSSIFIVDNFNKLKKQKVDRNLLELYMIGFKQKFFPIVSTILSTVLGFIPFVKDGQNEVFWFALSVGTIGGLLFSLIGILIYLPLFSISSKDVLKNRSNCGRQQTDDDNLCKDNFVS